MLSLNVLLKPYYTLEAVYNELKNFVSLDSAEDVLLLAKDKKIAVKLLCDRPITLIKARTSQLLKIPYIDTNELAEELVATEAVQEILKSEALNAVWISNDVDDFIYFDGANQEIFLRPINCIPTGPPTSLNYEYAESRWLKGFSPPVAGENLVAVEYENEIFFVCKSMASNPFGAKILNYGDEQRALEYRLDNFFVNNLISNNKYIVSQAELNSFISSHKDAFKESASSELVPSWEDLLNAPNKYSEIFECCQSGVIKFIEREKRLPGRKELWEELKKHYKYDEQKKVFLNISSTDTDWVTFRRYFNRISKKQV